MKNVCDDRQQAAGRMPHSKCARHAHRSLPHLFLFFIFCRICTKRHEVGKKRNRISLWILCKRQIWIKKNTMWNVYSEGEKKKERKKITENSIGSYAAPHRSQLWICTLFECAWIFCALILSWQNGKCMLWAYANVYVARKKKIKKKSQYRTLSMFFVFFFPFVWDKPFRLRTIPKKHIIIRYTHTYTHARHLPTPELK